MKHPVALAVIAVNLVVLVVLAFAYPQLMVSPGPLSKGHADLATDCWSCHAPWRGTAAARCTECHAPADIGVRTTEGVPIVAATPRIAFHQQLAVQDCAGCHSDHLGPRQTRRDRKPFAHELLRPAVQQRCEGCHAVPQGPTHDGLKAGCAECHGTRDWTVRSFDHALLGPQADTRCQSCHAAPKDRLHARLDGRCATCHGTGAWKPATFDHDRHFVLDREHDAECRTCHVGQDYSRYTCYGCHEHSPASIRAEHVEEGIRNFDDCVECHRSADDKGHGRGGRESRGERRRGGDDDD